MASPKLKKFVPFKDIILYEDDHILLVDKPLYMASLEDKEMRHLQGMSRGYNPELRLCHRLDKMTSGVLLMAKDPDSYRHVALQFQHRSIEKVYKTLIQGVHQFKDMLIDQPIYVSTNKKVSINPSGKKAQTIVNTERTFRNYSLLNCKPVTGRTHQIRIHLASKGVPIVGDQLYGGKDIFLSRLKRDYKPSGRREEGPLNHGYLLHAHQIKFLHPATEEEMEITAPFPKNFGVVLKMLEKYN